LPGRTGLKQQSVFHKNFGINISMEISQNFGGEYFYPLNPELPGYKRGTFGFTAVPG